MGARQGVGRGRRLWAALLAVVALGLPACGGGQVVPAPTEAAAIATDVATELLAPLEGLGPCGEAPQAVAEAGTVPGLHLPEGALVTAVSADGPVTQVEGWVPLTPIGVRADYVTREDLEVIRVEDEVWESETLVSDGEHRLFLKAQGICRTESVFVAIVSAEDGSAPQPLGQPS